MLRGFWLERYTAFHGSLTKNGKGLVNLCRCVRCHNGAAQQRA